MERPASAARRIAAPEFGAVATLDAVATHHPATGEVVLLATNRSVTESVVLDVGLRGFPSLRVVEALTLADPDHTWAASAGDDTSVVPRANDSAKVTGDRARAELPPVAWRSSGWARHEPSRPAPRGRAGRTTSRDPIG
ncbi:hypothetical protein [Nonomuraea candida]|uniref:hypothetical protein n=1 Tax=Nonomuraea candida TaxID=359159 RepID=UPI0005BE8083|nr:hypothetical protein [Nonomuraea candida]